MQPFANAGVEERYSSQIDLANVACTSASNKKVALPPPMNAAKAHQTANISPPFNSTVLQDLLCVCTLADITESAF